MKKTARILNLITSALLMLLGVIFTVIEGYLLFSGDFLLFESEFLAFIQIFLRLCLAISVFLLGLFTVLKKERSFLHESIALLLLVGMIAAFLTNGFGLYFTILAILHTLTTYLYSRYLVKQEVPEKTTKIKQ